MCCLSPPWLYVDISPEIAYKQMPTNARNIICGFKLFYKIQVR